MPYLISSAIRAVDYDPFMETLDIEFASRRVYTYHGVPEHIYHGLITAYSAGEYFNTYIKGRYS